VEDGVGGEGVEVVDVEELMPEPSGVQVFNYTGSYQEFVVPDRVRKVKIEVWGAQGGGTKGGLGGKSLGILDNLKGGDKLYVYVGGKGGEAGSTSNCGYGRASVGGWNGGGTGSGGNVGGGGGGGATEIKTFIEDRIIVAGGGGGEGHYNVSSFGGKGGGGNYACGNGDNSKTSSGKGGVCGNRTGAIGSNGSCYNGGGGGGGYKGGTGGGDCAGGGGGSGYIGDVKNGDGESGVREGDGLAMICWGDNGDCF
jgi:hypothetical protein